MAEVDNLTEEAADRLKELVMRRTGLTPETLDCPRAKSDMTPCVARDGSLAVTDDGICVGCWQPIETLLAAEKEKHAHGRETEEHA